MTAYFDTNVLVAAVLAEHPQHPAAREALRKVHARELGGAVSAHGLAELYAVLTRVPLTPPVYPGEAWQILERDLLPFFAVTELSGAEYRETLRLCAAAGWIGGRIYDALHITAARKAGCGEILTFNLRHFRELAADLAEIIRTP